MSLLQISEPNQSKTPISIVMPLVLIWVQHIPLVAVVRSGRSEVLAFGQSPLLPSVVYYGKKQPPYRR